MLNFALAPWSLALCVQSQHAEHRHQSGAEILGPPPRGTRPSHGGAYDIRICRCEVSQRLR